MFESIGFSEMLLIGIIALVVVGPKDLPILMRKAGQMMARVRAMANDFRASFDDMARQAELDELRKEVEALKTMQPLADVRAEFERPFDFDGHGGQTIHNSGNTPYEPPPSMVENTAEPAPAMVEPANPPPPKPPRKRAAKVKTLAEPIETVEPSREQAP